MCKLSLVGWYVYTLMFNRCKSRIKTYPPTDRKHCVYSLQGTGLWVLNVPWFLSAKFIIFMASCGPKTVSGWHCRGGLLSAIMFQSFGAMCFFWGSHEASVRKLTNWKGWFTSEKLQTQPNWTRLRSVHAQIYPNVFVSFQSQVKFTTDDVYYKHQITAMHRLAQDAYVKKTALV